METLTAMPLLAAVALGAWCVLMIAAAVADEIGRMNHTKEPWSSKIIIRSDTGDYMGSEIASVIGDSFRIADTLGSDVHTIADRANASRIVACVNAFAGMNPAALSELIVAVEQAIEAIDDVQGMLFNPENNILQDRKKQLQEAIEKLKGGV